MNLEPVGILIGFLAAVTVLLFIISALAFRRNPALKAGLICFLLCVLGAKNLVLIALYLLDEAPNFNPLMFLDVLVVLGMLVKMGLRK